MTKNIVDEIKVENLPKKGFCVWTKSSKQWILDASTLLDKVDGGDLVIVTGPASGNVPIYFKKVPSNKGWTRYKLVRNTKE
jgi:hypothetical protein